MSNLKYHIKYFCGKFSVVDASETIKEGIKVDEWCVALNQESKSLINDWMRVLGKNILSAVVNINFYINNKGKYLGGSTENLSIIPLDVFQVWFESNYGIKEFLAKPVLEPFRPRWMKPMGIETIRFVTSIITNLTDYEHSYTHKLEKGGNIRTALKVGEGAVRGHAKLQEITEQEANSYGVSLYSPEALPVAGPSLRPIALNMSKPFPRWLKFNNSRLEFVTKVIGNYYLYSTSIDTKTKNIKSFEKESESHLANYLFELSEADKNLLTSLNLSEYSCKFEAPPVTTIDRSRSFPRWLRYSHDLLKFVTEVDYSKGKYKYIRALFHNSQDRLKDLHADPIDSSRLAMLRELTEEDKEVLKRNNLLETSCEPQISIEIPPDITFSQQWLRQAEERMLRQQSEIIWGMPRAERICKNATNPLPAESYVSFNFGLPFLAPRPDNSLSAAEEEKIILKHKPKRKLFSTFVEQEEFPNIKLFKSKIHKNE